LTAATTSALRLTTQRDVEAGGRESSVSGSPSGPITCAGRAGLVSIVSNSSRFTVINLLPPFRPPYRTALKEG
jgi:hypothetical protein